LESWLGFGKQILPYRYVRRDLSHAGQVLESAISKTKSKSKTFSDHPYYIVKIGKQLSLPVARVRPGEIIPSARVRPN